MSLPRHAAASRATRKPQLAAMLLKAGESLLSRHLRVPLPARHRHSLAVGHEVRRVTLCLCNSSVRHGKLETAL